MPDCKEQIITETLEENYMPYAMSVIISRAIPEIDGFKPSHRKLLYTMYKMGLLKSPRTKSANVVGQTMKLNPHGDSAIYETMVRLTEGNEALLHPFVDSKGNFGKQYSRDMAYAASRYTEVRLAEICDEVFQDIEKDSVPFVDNYDNKLKEPVLLPVKFPNILANCNQGIAVGMASNICSFNLHELCIAAAEYIKNPDMRLLDYIKAPDFPTGGSIIYDEEAFTQIYSTGRGSMKVQSVYNYDKQNNCIDITEIPYTTTIEAIIDKIAELIKQGKIKEISDVRDETDLNGLKITIDLKRGCDAKKLMSKLFRFTPLQDSFSCNFNILVGNVPKTMGIKQILDEWTAFRIKCIKSQCNFDMNKKSQKLHLLKGLEKILLDIDRVIKIIRGTESDSLVITNLMNSFSIDRPQAEFIAEIKLRHLNKEYILNRTEEIKNLEDEIKTLGEILEKDDKVKEIIISQLLEISEKYKKPRKTKIISKEESIVADFADEIDDYAVSLFLTRDGYFKKISAASLRASSNHMLKENDEIIWSCETGNKSELLIFSSEARVYKLRTHELSDCKAKQLGEYLPGLLGYTEGEKTLLAVATGDFKGCVAFVFQNGKVSKIELESYKTKLNRRKLTNAYYGGVPLVRAVFLPYDADIVLFDDFNKALIFNTSLLQAKSTKTSSGVSVMKLRKSCILESAKLLSESNISDTDYYRVRTLPSAGKQIKESDLQIKLDID